MDLDKTYLGKFAKRGFCEPIEGFNKHPNGFHSCVRDLLTGFDGLQLKIEKLGELVKAKNELLACYRIGRRAPEKLLNKLERLREALEEE